MIDQCAALALAAQGAALPAEWPLPELVVPADEIARLARAQQPARRRRVSRAGAGRGRRRRSAGTITARSPQTLARAGPSRSGSSAGRAKPRRRRKSLRRSRRCATSPARTCATPSSRSPPADVAVSNDSGLLHVAAALEHARDRHFRADRSVALGAAQSARRGGADRQRAALPALPQAGLPGRPSPLHARHRGGKNSGGGRRRARKSDGADGQTRAARERKPGPRGALIRAAATSVNLGDCRRDRRDVGACVVDHYCWSVMIGAACRAMWSAQANHRGGMRGGMLGWDEAGTFGMQEDKG